MLANCANTFFLFPLVIGQKHRQIYVCVPVIFNASIWYQFFTKNNFRELQRLFFSKKRFWTLVINNYMKINHSQILYGELNNYSQTTRILTLMSINCKHWTKSESKICIIYSLQIIILIKSKALSLSRT